MGRKGFLGLAIEYVVGAIGTFGLAIAAILWFDYHQQSFEARIPSEEYSIGQWMGTFVSRGQALLQRGALIAGAGGSLNRYFPESTAGWERRDWSPSYERILHKIYNRSGDLTDDQLAIRDEPLRWAEENAGKALRASYDKRAASRSAVYVKGDRIVTLTARYANPVSNSEKMVATELRHGFRDGKLARSFGGYAFHHLKSSAWQYELTAKNYRLRGRIGDELEIWVTTNAKLSQVSQILASLDYKGLGEAVGISEADAQARQVDLTAKLERQTREERQRQADMLADIERRLASKVRRARGSGVQQVCLKHSGKDYCAWVDN